MKMTGMIAEKKTTAHAGNERQSLCDTKAEEERERTNERQEKRRDKRMSGESKRSRDEGKRGKRENDARGKGQGK